MKSEQPLDKEFELDFKGELREKMHNVPRNVLRYNSQHTLEELCEGIVQFIMQVLEDKRRTAPVHLD